MQFFLLCCPEISSSRKIEVILCILFRDSKKLWSIFFDELNVWDDKLSFLRWVHFSHETLEWCCTIVDIKAPMGTFEIIIIDSIVPIAIIVLYLDFACFHPSFLSSCFSYLTDCSLFSISLMNHLTFSWLVSSSPLENFYFSSRGDNFGRLHYLIFELSLYFFYVPF